MNYSKIFHCKNVTPIFIKGVNRNSPELRPPSIRGVARWWFRAMMGGIIGDNIEGLKKLETIVFGNNETASSISIKLKNYDYINDRYAMLPHKEDERRAVRKAIKINQDIDIELKLNPWVKDNAEEIFEVAKYSLLLLFKFGGIGTRQRRGYGSLYFNDELSEKELIKKAIEKFGNLSRIYSVNNNDWTEIPKYPCIAENYFEVWKADLSKGWEETIVALMNVMSNFKATNPARNAIGGTTPNTHQASPLIVHLELKNNHNEPNLFMRISHFRTELSSNFSIDNDDREALNEFIRSNLSANKIDIFDEE